MKVSALKYTVLSWVSGLAMVMLLLLPFHAFLTVWLSSAVGHYTAIRLWKEVLLMVCSIGALYLLAFDTKIRSHTLSRRLVWLILTYIALTIAWGLVGLAGHDITAKALGYGLIIDLRFPLFFLTTWAAALRISRLRTHWQWIVYVPAAGVVIFGLLQIFILPHDVLRHFGYGPATIPVSETINSNQQYYRIASTLRGANPLGAYLVLPITLVVILLVQTRRNWRRQTTFLVASLIVLLFSFSRSAWIGVLLSVAAVLFVAADSPRLRRFVGLGVAGVTVLAVLGIAVLHNNAHFQNLIFHTDDRSKISQSSNEGHTTALRAGLQDVTSEPLGRGPGTAGPASVYNTGHPVRISENYFLQVGQETGWIGLTLFLFINIGVGYLLWLRRSDPLALSLFASLVGLTFINLLSHAWADDTLAYIWWGLAGMAIVRLPQVAHEATKK